MWSQIVRTVQILAMSLAMGFVAGAGLAMSDISEFSLLPPTSGFLLPALAGLFVGMLTYSLSQALGILLLVIVISPVVSAVALAYPELQIDRLGFEVSLQLSLVNSLQRAILGALLAMAGLLLGRVIVRHE